LPRLFETRDPSPPPGGAFRRLAGSIFSQQATCHVCPEDADLSGKLALVTGGSRGIGLEITRGLARLGADVIVAARGKEDTMALCAALGHETNRKISFVPLDLADKRSIEDAASAIEAVRGDRAIEIFCANAGVSSTKWQANAEGHEICYATNCLGHHRLLSHLLARKVLHQAARVVFTTGDIYILSKDCTPDFRFTGRSVAAYARSKLGNLWQVKQLQELHPRLHVLAVHPGVVATELEGSLHGVAGFVKRKLFISPELGAQPTLIAATQDLPGGGYFHGKFGLLELGLADPVNDVERRAIFWDNLCAETW
jgi:retinol dehydrogenase-12